VVFFVFGLFKKIQWKRIRNLFHKKILKSIREPGDRGDYLVESSDNRKINLKDERVVLNPPLQPINYLTLTMYTTTQ